MSRDQQFEFEWDRLLQELIKASVEVKKSAIAHQATDVRTFGKDAAQLSMALLCLRFAADITGDSVNRKAERARLALQLGMLPSIIQ